MPKLYKYHSCVFAVETDLQAGAQYKYEVGNSFIVLDLLKKKNVYIY